MLQEKKMEKKSQKIKNYTGSSKKFFCMMKDMADKTNLCTSDPRYQEMLSFMKETAWRDMKQKMEGHSESIWEEVSIVAASNKKNEKEQGKMKQQSSSSLAGKRCEDKQGNEAGNFLGLQNTRKGMRQPGKRRSPGGMKVRN